MAFTNYTKKVTGTLAFLALSVAAVAQTGPGGVGSSSTNLLWVAADTGVYTDAGSTLATDGQSVQQWNDLSGNSSNLSQTTGTNQPTYETNEVNSQPVLRFDGSTDYFQQSMGSLSAPFSVVALYYFNSLNQGVNDFDVVYNMGQGGGSTGVNMMFARTASNFGSGADLYYLFDGASVRTGPTLTGQTYEQFTQIHRSSSTRHNLFINGASQTVTDYTSNAATNGNLNIGRYSNAGNGNHYFNGDIAEFAVFNFELNTAQRKIIENYMAAKYGLTISNDMFAHQGTHPHDVFGLGRDDSSNEHTDAQGMGIVRINTASSLGDGDYILIGHDNGSLNATQGELPSAYNNLGSRLPREWYVDQTNDVGTVTIVFDLDGIQFGSTSTYELLIDSDGDFTSGATRHTTGLSFDDVNNTVTFTTADLCNDCYFTLGNASTTITSSGTGDFGTSGTWDCECTPQSWHNTNVSAGNTVTLTTNTSATDVTVIASGTLVFQSGVELTMSGDLSISGTLTQSTGKVNLNGSAAQTISNNSGSTVQLYDLELNNSNGATFNNGEFEVENGVTLTAGTMTIDPSGTMTLLSDATRQAAVTSVGTGTMSGSLIMKRFVSSRVANWGDIAAPVSGVTISNWDSDMFMSGVGGSDGDACCPVFYSVYKYNAATAAFDTIQSTSTAVNTGEGVQLWLASSTDSLSSFTFQSKGTVDLTTQALSLTSGGWNLLGNPFPAFLSWTDISSGLGATIADEFYVFNAATGNYSAYGDGNNIPPHQGFWVQSNSASSLSLAPSHIANSNATTFLKRDTRTNNMKLELTSDAIPYSHETFIGFDGESVVGTDHQDLTFLPSRQAGAPNVTSVRADDDARLYRNMQPLGQDYVEIPLVVDVDLTGTYTLTAKDLDNISQYSCILLEDVDNQVFVDLHETKQFDFRMDNAEVNRTFKLHLMTSEHEDCDKNENEELVDAAIPVIIENNSNGVFVDFGFAETTDATISVYNLLGQKVTADEGVNVSTTRHQVNLSKVNTGSYIVVVDTPDGRVTQKVFAD